MAIGLIGLGNMGRPIAEHLNDLGEPLVLWNRTRQKAEGIGNSRIMDCPADVVVAADITLSLMADDNALEHLYHGPGGILDVDLTGKTIVEFCTTSPETMKALEAAVEAKGGQFVECPVSGNVVPARSGQLMGLAAGKKDAFESAKPTLDKLTRRLEYLGETGAGSAMKLAVNLPLMVYWSALGEAVGLALSKGIDLEKALDILVDSSGAIGAAKKRVPPILKMLVEEDAGDVAFSLRNAIKDMKLMKTLAEENDRPSGVISATLAKAEDAGADGWLDFDSALVGVHGQTGGTS